ncbi:hypothetical protein HYU14_02290 [Candidatus Woesearchaeota archaeon]|nr:hypothetical protein [Candidatus Woesearchaeota archaeon]
MRGIDLMFSSIAPVNAFTKLAHWLKANKRHFLYLGIIIVLILLFLKDSNITDKVRGSNELASMHYFYFNDQRKSILEFGQFPLWSPTIYAGSPLFALPQSSTLLLHAFLPALFIDNLETSLNLIAITNTILAAIFMYLLMLVGFRVDARYSFLASLLFVFNWYFIHLTPSWVDRGKVVLFAPLFLLFTILALRKKRFAVYSVLAGITLALQFIGGGVDYFMLGIIVPMFFYLVEGFIAAMKKNFPRLIKLFLVGLISGAVFAGLIMVQVLPISEFKPYSSKASGFSYEKSKGGILFPEKVLTFPYNTEGIEDNKGGTRIGTVAFLLFLGSFLAWRKKTTIYFYILLTVSILIAVGTSAYYPFWAFIPGFKAIHNVIRALWVTEFAIAALVAFGAYELFKRIDLSGWKKYSGYLFWILTVLLIIDLIILPWPKFYHHKPNSYPLKDGVMGEAMKNEMMLWVARQPGLFRIHNVRNNEIAGWTPMYISALNLSELMGVASVWVTEHLNVYMSIAHNSPAKFWGMLNTKYIYSNGLLNESDLPERYRRNLTLIKVFPPCPDCKENPPQDQGVAGPYLYQNDLFLPRAMLVNNSIFITGDDSINSNAQNLMYGLLLREDINPGNTAIILKRSKDPPLQKSTLDQSSYIIFQEQVNPELLSGDISSPKYITSDQKLNDAIASLKGGYKEMNISYYSPNKLIIPLKGEKGILVLAEKFFLFPGWSAKVKDGKTEIPLELFRANGISTAMYLDGESGDLIITYRPRSFIIGAAVSLMALAVVLLYLGYELFLFLRRKSQQELDVQPK